MIAPMPRSTDTTGAPSWVKDHMEGLDVMAHERWVGELEVELPGISQIFQDLIDSLPYEGEITTEFPIAAALVKKDENGALTVLSSSLNKVNEKGNSSAHAEREVLDEAQEIVGSKHLDDTWLVSTMQPCVECTGAAMNTGVRGVVYGAKHADLEGKHARVQGRYKRFRTTPEGFDTDELLRQSGIVVISGFMGEKALKRTVDRTHGSWDSYFRDPDSRGSI